MLTSYQLTIYQFKNIIMSPFDMPTTNPIGPRYKFAQTKLFTVC